MCTRQFKLTYCGRDLDSLNINQRTNGLFFYSMFNSVYFKYIWNIQENLKKQRQDVLTKHIS